MRTRRVAICGLEADSAAALGDFLERDPGIEVVDVLATPEELLARGADAAPDLLTLDLTSQADGGTEAIERIMHERPVPILILEDEAPDAAERAAAALAAGALEALPKARLRLEHPDDVWATAVRGRVKRLASVRMARPENGDRGPSSSEPLVVDRRVRVVGIGASTGGPPALTTVLSGLPGDYPVPVLVVQHIADGFGEGLVSWLDQRVAPPVRFARDGEPLRPGVWFPPDDTHLAVDSQLRFVLDRELVRGPHRPSVDVLFESLAAAAGPEAAAVVLTGMGRDGTAGVQALRSSGGLVIAQDGESSAVFGMPRAAIESGVDHVLSLADVGPALRSLRAVQTA